MQSYIQIDSEVLKNNLKEFRTYVGKGIKIILVVKANAYGHGMKEVVSSLNEEADAFAVDDIHELHTIRFYTQKDVYVLGHVSRKDVDTLIDLEGIPLVTSIEELAYFSKRVHVVGQKLRINVKVDALLGRQGILLDQVSTLLNHVKKTTNIELCGVYSHFSNIEDTDDVAHALKQLEMYNQALSIVKEHGYYDIQTHIASTAGICIQSSFASEFTHVRLGVGLYGSWPSERLRSSAHKTINISPCMRWVTHIAEIKVLPAGHPVGYGLTYITKSETAVAVIPQGYSDGYDRKLSNNSDVLIAGTRCPVLGRVAMNMFVVDVTQIRDNVTVDDEVVLLGKQGEEEITAEELARKVHTIPYEIVSRLNPLIPREVV